MGAINGILMGVYAVVKDGEKVNTMCYTPDISGLLKLKKRILM